MKNTVMNAIGDLQDAVMGSSNAVEFVEYVMHNKDLIANALQVIADTDSEPHIEVMTMVLWKCCPEEEETHVLQTMQVWKYVINNAWENCNQDVNESLTGWVDEMVKHHGIKKTKKGKKVGQLPTEPNPMDVEHLNKCLQLNMG
jgi:hypothetical protein